MAQSHKPQAMDFDLAAENRRMGRWVLVLVLCFFSVIIAVNVTMAVLANRNWSGLVVKSAYVEGQAFNQKVADARAQAERNWHSALSFDQGVLRFQISDAQGQALDFQRARVEIGRPAFEQQDVVLELTQDASGGFGRCPSKPLMRKGNPIAARRVCSCAMMAKGCCNDLLCAETHNTGAGRAGLGRWTEPRTQPSSDGPSASPGNRADWRRTRR